MTSTLTLPSSLALVSSRPVPSSRQSLAARGDRRMRLPTLAAATAAAAPLGIAAASAAAVAAMCLRSKELRPTVQGQVGSWSQADLRASLPALPDARLASCQDRRRSPAPPRLRFALPQPHMPAQSTPWNSAILSLCPSLTAPYRLPALLNNGHVETIFAAWFRRRPHLLYDREIVHMWVLASVWYHGWLLDHCLLAARCTRPTCWHMAHHANALPAGPTAAAWPWIQRTILPAR